jgi:RNA polymerase sigma-70 factor (sigma-E family)
MDLDDEFVAFVRRRGDHHLRTAVLLTGNWHTAEDLMQTCLVKLYRAWPRLDIADDPDAYLRRVLVNTHRSWWRTRWRREVPVATFPDHATAGVGEEQYEVAETVRRALAILPVRQRTALVLRFFEDLPAAEVAQLMGCSVGSIKTHVHRGLRSMRRLLRPADRAGPEQLADQAVNETPGQGSEVR